LALVAGLAATIASSAVAPLASAQDLAAPEASAEQQNEADRIERDLIAPALLALNLLDRHGAPADVVLAFEHYPPEVRADPRAVLIYARALTALGRAEDARDALRAAVARHPENTRLRAELARSLFDANRDDAARVQFELALAQNGDAALSPDERGAVRAYLTTIDQRRTWRWRASFAIAPDSNIHAATSAEQIELFGLPFRLHQASRQKSGIGLQYGVGATGRFGELAFAPGFWRLEADLHGQDYGGAMFDQSRLGVRAGPRVQTSPNTQLGFDLLGEKRWRSGADYSTAYGLEANLFARPSERVSLRAAAAVRNSDEADGRRRDGLHTSLDFAVSRRGAPDRLLETRLYLLRGDLEDAAESFWFGYASLGAYRELRGGVGLYVEPYVSYRRHDDPDPFFARPRIDREHGVQIRASKRDWTIFDAAPYISVLVSTRSSTNPLYDDADRIRSEFGFTRTF
jgi:hypothetical protein